MKYNIEHSFSLCNIYYPASSMKSWPIFQLYNSHKFPWSNFHLEGTNWRKYGSILSLASIKNIIFLFEIRKPPEAASHKTINPCYLCFSSSISKFEERCCFLYVLHNSDDFQIYFCTEHHCKKYVLANYLYGLRDGDPVSCCCLGNWLQLTGSSLTNYIPPEHEMCVHQTSAY